MIVTPEEVHATALRELRDLGPEPASGWQRALWVQDRDGAVVFIASIAGCDATLLRQAAHCSRSAVTDAAFELLMDAIDECSELRDVTAP